MIQDRRIMMKSVFFFMDRSDELFRMNDWYTIIQQAVEPLRLATKKSGEAASYPKGFRARC